MKDAALADALEVLERFGLDLQQAPDTSAQDAVAWHSSRGGTGYPDGLAGESVPLLARVLAVADACDAMMAARPYRAALRPEGTEAALREGAGRQWDPDVAAAFLACRDDLYSLCERGPDRMAEAVERALELGRPDDPSRLLGA